MIAPIRRILQEHFNRIRSHPPRPMRARCSSVRYLGAIRRGWVVYGPYRPQPYALRTFEAGGHNPLDHPRCKFTIDDNCVWVVLDRSNRLLLSRSGSGIFPPAAAAGERCPLPVVLASLLFLASAAASLNFLVCFVWSLGLPGLMPSSSVPERLLPFRRVLLLPFSHHGIKKVGLAGFGPRPGLREDCKCITVSCDENWGALGRFLCTVSIRQKRRRKHGVRPSL